ncbi:MAG: hypothetical protein N2558_04100 [Patescibacteria group bacterium]|nr:hypothetical protein [Patescibacteria group bacterium]
MKQLLIYINPVDKKFSQEHDTLTKIQIDNCLSLGIPHHDIILVTNFEYKYKGISPVMVADYSVFDQNRSTKIPAINELFDRNLIDDNEVYWFHDHDAFQLVSFEVKLSKDAGFTTHGAYNPKLWNAGSFFFKKSARDIFEKIYYYMNLHNSNEQNALTYMWENNIDNINERYEMMNQTYNIGIYKIAENLAISEKPIKVAHFHPHKKHHLDKYRQILPERLMKIFAKYGIY